MQEKQEADTTEHGPVPALDAMRSPSNLGAWQAREALGSDARLW